ncbi:hypothetical protein GWP43_05335 [Treponema vincentii]|uniref:Polymorphic outer membrane protein n=1 Tax=Treponema vincentii TaxID=69710 RepID=A0A6P1XZU1_9SPIR|nr:hypothetical protein [Treponema vincentii]QHX42961.1 hypothetical protein GWP43_05335 [Treponema vincentii]
MRKLCTIITGIFLTLLFTNCQPFKDNIEDYLSYWSAEVIATDYRINPSYSTNAAGVLCVPSIAANGSDTDVTVTVNLHNPKNFTLKTPSSSADAGKVIRFPGLSTQPTYGDTKDYSLTQTALDTLTLTYKSSFLKKYEWGTGDISPEITFRTADNDRVFRQKFRLNLKADTVPALEYKGVGKTLVDGERYYVLIFQAKGMDAMIGTEYVHRDIKKLHITKEGGASAVYTIQNINFSSQTFSWSLGDPFLNTADDLEIGDYEGSKPPFPAPTDKWLIYYKTDIEISPSSAAKTYTAQLSDAAGLRSNEVECSTVKWKVGFIDLVVTNPSSYLPQSGETGEHDQPYSVRCDENGAILQATCNTPPGVTISYTVYDITSSPAVETETSKGSGASPLTGIRLITPATVGGTKNYKVALKATAPGFTEYTRDVYYTLTRAGAVTIDASRLRENEKWKKLREAVENATAGDIITIKGEIKATNDTGNYGEITINKDLTIRGKSGKETDILNADTAATGKTHRIFNVQTGKTLTLSGLTLKNATASSGGNGGAILVNITNGKVVLSNCTIKDCKAGTNGTGGGIFVQSSGRAELSNCTIEGCNANGGSGGAIGSQGGTVTITGCTLTGNSATDGGAVYVTSSGVFTMHSGTISDNMVQSTASKTRGGGVFVSVGATFTMKGGTISGNTATTQGSTGTKAMGGGICVSGDGQLTKFIMEGDSPKITGNKVKTAAGSNLSTIGGGVCVYDGATFEMKAGSIENNEARDGNAQYFGHAGGGVCVGDSVAGGTTGASFTMTGGTISKNKAGYGGGVAVTSKSTFTMKGGTIGGANEDDKNTATTESGGGVAVMHGTFTMEGGMISKNTAAGYGGGIHSMNFNGNKGVITVKGTSVISNNTANSGGGGISSSHQLTIEPIDSNSPVIKENTTGSYGGGIYLPYNSTLTFTGGTVTDNTASSHGSGIYLQDKTTTVKMSGTATVKAGNDVYLGGTTSDYSFITVTGALTGQQAAMLTMQNDNAGYNEGREVVKGSSSYTLGGENVNKFPITKQTVPSEQKWTTELGTNALKLKKKTS